MQAVIADPSLKITIDVERRLVTAIDVGIEEPFPMDDFTRYRLLEGLDDIGLTLRNEDALSRYEQSRPSWLPVVQVPARAEM